MLSNEVINEKVFWASEAARQGTPMKDLAPEFYSFVNEQFAGGEFWSFHEKGTDSLSSLIRDALKMDRGVTWAGQYFWIGTHEEFGNWMVIQDQGDMGASGVDGGQLFVRGLQQRVWDGQGNVVGWEQPTEESTRKDVESYFLGLLEFER